MNLQTNTDSDDEGVVFVPKSGDVLIGKDSHPGTKKWRKSIHKAAEKHPKEPVSPPIYRRVKKRFTDSRFLIPNDENDPTAGWHDAKRSEIVRDFKLTFEEEKGKLVLDDSEKEEVEEKGANKISGSEAAGNKPDRLNHSNGQDKGTNEIEQPNAKQSPKTKKRGSKKVNATKTVTNPDGTRIVSTDYGGEFTTPPVSPNSGKRKSKKVKTTRIIVNPDGSTQTVIIDGKQEANEASILASSQAATSPPTSPGSSQSKRRSSQKNDPANVTTTTITINPDGSQTVTKVIGVGNGVLTSKKMSNNSNEEKIKTVTMFFPASSIEGPQIAAESLPVSQCPQEIISGIQNGAHSTSPTVMSQSNGANKPRTYVTPKSVYGRSIFQVPNSHARLVAEADHEPFAPCGCICYQCCVGDQQRARTYARVYENRLETNYPCAPWCCWTPEYCIVDRVMVYYFDKGPHQTYCGLLAAFDCCGPFCGPPVVYTHVPRCCGCIDCRPCFGETLKASACSFWGLRVCCCCGTPCYEYCCNVPIAKPIKNGRDFLEKYRGAVDDYAKIRPLQRHTIFNRVSDKLCNCDKVTVVSPAPIKESLRESEEYMKLIQGAIPKGLVMDR